MKRPPPDGHPDFAAARHADASGDFAEMLACAERLKQQFPASSDPDAIRGYAYLGLRQYKNAVDAFSSSLDLAPHTDACWQGLAQAYAALGQWEKAVMALVAYVMVNTLDPQGWSALREAYVNAGLTDYIPGVDRALALLATGADFKIPRLSLYWPDVVGWVLLKGPPLLEKNWDNWFENSAEVKMPEGIKTATRSMRQAKRDARLRQRLLESFCGGCDPDDPVSCNKTVDKWLRQNVKGPRHPRVPS